VSVPPAQVVEQEPVVMSQAWPVEHGLQAPPLLPQSDGVLPGAHCLVPLASQQPPLQAVKVWVPAQVVEQ
jgi:hypothetical protein